MLVRLRKILYSRNELEEIDANLKNDISSLESYLQSPAIDEFTNAFDDVKEAESNLEFTYNLLEKIKKFRKEFIENFDTI